MSLREIGEFGFIDRIQKGCLIRPERVVKAIGDDAAAFESLPDTIGLLTADMLVDRVHFLRGEISGFDLGYKALAVNLSDIAAMGGIAGEAFVSIAVPESCELDYLEEIYSGMKTLAQKYDVNILGGDTTGSKADLVINVAVYGMVPPDQILYRSGACPGDVVFCTGYLGESRAGLQMLLKSLPADSPALASLLAAHFRPEPHLNEGRFLATAGGVHAAIDVSDGLSSDLGHILEESAVGVELYADDLPVSEPLREFCSRFGEDPQQYALAGGEDYVLLGTCAPERAERLALDFEKKFGRPLFRFGKITAGKQRLLIRPDGQRIAFESTGWNHFSPGAKPAAP